MGSDAQVQAGEFGSCCADLDECLKRVPESFFEVDDSGVLFLTVGFVQTEDGTGWFDHAVIFCPFCGTQIQDPAEVTRLGEEEEAASGEEE